MKNVLTEHMSRTVMMRKSSKDSSEIGGVKITVNKFSPNNHNGYGSVTSSIDTQRGGGT